MSYDIYIGNAIPTSVELDDGEFYAMFRGVTVEGRANDDAPTFPNDAMTANGNSRHPGYRQWSEFCREAGLRALFFDESTGLLRRHPGTFALEPHHLATVQDARARWKAEHADAVPGWDHDPQWHGNREDDGIRGRDGVLARLIWLEYWMEWTLKNCERPAIHNH